MEQMWFSPLNFSSRRDVRMKDQHRLADCFLLEALLYCAILFNRCFYGLRVLVALPWCLVLIGRHQSGWTMVAGDCRGPRISNFGALHPANTWYHVVRCGCVQPPHGCSAGVRCFGTFRNQAFTRHDRHGPGIRLQLCRKRNPYDKLWNVWEALGNHGKPRGHWTLWMILWGEQTSIMFTETVWNMASLAAWHFNIWGSAEPHPALSFSEALWGRLVVETYAFANTACGLHLAPLASWVNHSLQPNVTRWQGLRGGAWTRCYVGKVFFE